MKKFIMFVVATLVAMVSMSNFAMAQWFPPTHHQADELTGTSEYYSNLYEGDSGYFVCWSNDNNVKIVAKRGIFDYNDDYVNVIVGFYEGENLIEKVETKFYVPQNESNTAYTSDYKSPKGLGYKIKNHIKTKGDVRIIASKYSGIDFDLTVPMNEKIVATN